MSGYSIEFEKIDSGKVNTYTHTMLLSLKKGTSALIYVNSNEDFKVSMKFEWLNDLLQKVPAPLAFDKYIRVVFGPSGNIMCT